MRLDKEIVSLPFNLVENLDVRFKDEVSVFDAYKA